MDSSRLLFFLFVNIVFLLVAILAFFVVSIYRQRNRGKSDVLLSKIEPTLQILGFTKREWQRGIPFRPFEMLDGYYQGLVQGKQYEIHIFPEGTRPYQTNPQMEIVLLGYFNARLSIFTPGWEKSRPHLEWQMPQHLIVPGLDDLSIRTADEKSARLLLDEPTARDPILAMLNDQEEASVVIAPQDIHFNFQVDDWEGITPFVVQDWLGKLAEIARIAAALPSLPAEARMDFSKLPRRTSAGRERLFILLLLVMVILPTIIAYLMLTR